MFGNKVLAWAGILSCALMAQGAHALEPAVAFVGGNIMNNWQNSGVFGSTTATSQNFLPLWLKDGFQISDGAGVCRETSEAQTIVNGFLQNYPNVEAFHLMVGADDVVGTSDANPPAYVFGQWQACYTDLVDSILKAHKKVVLGTIPFTIINDPTPYNDFIFALAARKDVPVINYYDLLRNANNNFEGNEYWIPASSLGETPSITNKGYTIMNQAATLALNELLNRVTLKAGYLGVDSLQQTGEPPFVPAAGLNTVAPNTEMHWSAYGQYSDGTTFRITNANIDHLLGTWKSSNSEVVKIQPDGTAWALAPGTANIHFTTLNGQTINEWVMYVKAYEP